MPNDQHGNLLRVNILPRHAVNVSGGDFFNRGAILFEEIRGVSVELIGHAFRQHFFIGIKGKDKGIQD